MRHGLQRRQDGAKAREDNLPAAAGENLGGDGLSDCLGLESWGEKAAIVLVAGKQRRLGVALIDHNGAHARSLVPRLELGRQALVEGQGGCLGGSIVDHVGHGHKRRVAGNSHDHAVVALDHGGDKLPGQDVVRNGVDVKGKAVVTFGGLEDGLTASDASVVDEDGGFAPFGTDLGGGRSDLG